VYEYPATHSYGASSYSSSHQVAPLAIQTQDKQ